MAKKPFYAAGRLNGWAAVVRQCIASRQFFWLLLGLFGVEALWIAISARYPQAFDEQFHFGLIKLYSTHLSPFLSSQPSSADQFGVVFRDPSFLYHYAFGFVYRVLQILTHSEALQVISLRFINIGFFITGILLARRLLDRLGLSPMLRNMVVAVLLFMPVMPLLAAHINYDNAVFALAMWFFLVFLSIVRQLQAARIVAWNQLAGLLVIGVTASLVKYAFLPIFAMTVIVLAWLVVRSRRKVATMGLAGWLRQPRAWLLIGLLLLGIGLLAQREGLNLVRYHNPIPECDQILSVQRCQAYSPWARNYQFQNLHIQLQAVNIATYPFVWLYHMQGESVFTITSYFDQTGTVQYTVGTQFILVEILFWSLFVLSVCCGVLCWRWLWSQYELRLLLIIAMVYVMVLFLQNFADYLHIGLPVAIHGRYLLPVLPILLAASCLVIRRALLQVSWSRFNATIVQAVMAVGTLIILLLQGGGFVTYIVRSDPSWFWPQNPKIQQANDRVRKALKPVVVDVKKR